MDGRTKLLLVLSGGIMLGGLMGASSSVLRRGKGTKKGSASKGAGADKRGSSTGRAKSGRTAALLNR
eukprot:6859532-Pyramimonas_sp.AAC.2